MRENCCRASVRAPFLCPGSDSLLGCPWAEQQDHALLLHRDAAEGAAVAPESPGGMSKLSLKQQWTQNPFWLKPAQVSLSYSTLHCSLVWVQLSCLFCWQHWKHGGSAAPRELHVQRRMYNLNPSKHDNCSEEGMIIGINPLKSFYSGWMPLLS